MGAWEESANGDMIDTKLMVFKIRVMEATQREKLIEITT